MDLSTFNFNYNSAFHYACVKNCVFQVLESYGVSNALLYINCVPDLLIEETQNQSLTFGNYSNLCPLLPEVSGALHRFVYNEPNDFCAWEDGAKIIRQGFPIIAMVDTFYLPYRQHDYNIRHGAHAVIVHDINEKKNCVSIVDWYEPYFFKGDINKSIYSMARGSKNGYSSNPFSGHSLEYEWFYLDKDVWQEDPSQLFFSALSLMVDRCYQLYEPTKVVYSGIFALDKIFSLVGDLTEKGHFTKLHQKMFVEYRTKKLFRYYVANYISLVRRQDLNDLYKEISRLNELWDVFMTTLLRSSLKLEYAQKLGQISLALTKQEHVVIDMVRDLCTSRHIS